MIKKINAITAMKASKGANKEHKVSGTSFLAVGHAIRSNRVIITERRDLPLVGPARAIKK